MVRTVLSFTCYGLALGSFVAWFVATRRLGRDPSAAGQLSDQLRQRRLRGLLAGGLAALITAYLL